MNCYGTICKFCKLKCVHNWSNRKFISYNLKNISKKRARLVSVTVIYLSTKNKNLSFHDENKDDDRAFGGGGGGFVWFFSVPKT